MLCIHLALKLISLHYNWASLQKETELHTELKTILQSRNYDPKTFDICHGYATGITTLSSEGASLIKPKVGFSSFWTTKPAYANLFSVYNLPAFLSQLITGVFLPACVFPCITDSCKPIKVNSKIACSCKNIYDYMLLVLILTPLCYCKILKKVI